MNLSEFKKSLSKSNIKVNGRLDNMIRRSEGGEQVSYVNFGKEIFQQVEEREGNNPDYSRPSSP